MKKAVCFKLSPAAVDKLHAMVEQDKEKPAGNALPYQMRVNQSTMIEALIMREANSREAKQ